MVRVAKSRYLETPSRILESIPGIERSRYCGNSHHHWLCELTLSGIQLTFKHAQLHGYSRFYLTVGPQFLAGASQHSWVESVDHLHQILTS